MVDNFEEGVFMTLGLTKSGVEKILDTSKLDYIIDRFEKNVEGNPQLTGAFGLRELISELIIKNNQRIKRQLSAAGISIS